MRIVIAGSRHYTDYDEAAVFIKTCLMGMTNSEPLIILSGGCRGADQLGERYATEHELEIAQFLPNWRLYGKGAGLIRNQQMAETCDAVICFRDGKSLGTKALIGYAQSAGKPVFIKYI